MNGEKEYTELCEDEVTPVADVTDKEAAAVLSGEDAKSEECIITLHSSNKQYSQTGHWNVVCAYLSAEYAESCLDQPSTGKVSVYVTSKNEKLTTPRNLRWLKFLLSSVNASALELSGGFCAAGQEYLAQNISSSLIVRINEFNCLTFLNVLPKENKLVVFEAKWQDSWRDKESNLEKENNSTIQCIQHARVGAVNIIIHDLQENSRLWKVAWDAISTALKENPSIYLIRIKDISEASSKYTAQEDFEVGEVNFKNRNCRAKKRTAKRAVKCKRDARQIEQYQSITSEVEPTVGVKAKDAGVAMYLTSIAENSSAVCLIYARKGRGAYPIVNISQACKHLLYANSLTQGCVQYIDRNQHRFFNNCHTLIKYNNELQEDSKKIAYVTKLFSQWTGLSKFEGEICAVLNLLDHACGFNFQAFKYSTVAIRKVFGNETKNDFGKLQECVLSARIAIESLRCNTWEVVLFHSRKADAAKSSPLHDLPQELKCIIMKYLCSSKDYSRSFT